jgi:hypothetical protein
MTASSVSGVFDGPLRFSTAGVATVARLRPGIREHDARLGHEHHRLTATRADRNRRTLAQDVLVGHERFPSGAVHVDLRFRASGRFTISRQ